MKGVFSDGNRTDGENLELSQPGLGMPDDGIPRRMAGYRWLGNWEEEIPRLTNENNFRKEKLMALGNAIVPQVAEMIFRAIKEIGE